MFDRVVDARNEKGRGIKTLLFGVSAALHAVGIAGLLVWSFWTIEKVTPKMVPLSFVNAAQPPPPPPPPAAPPAPQKVATKAPPKVVKDVVQPVAKPDPEPRPDPEPSEAPSGPVDPGAVPGGVPGAPGGVPGGTGTAPCEGPDCGGPVVEEKPVVIDLQTAEAQRISGNRDIALPPAVSQELRAQGKSGTMALVQLCLSAAGTPTKVVVRRSTGFPEADARIASEVQGWRYRAYTVNGRAVPICTAVTFQYRLE